MAEREIDPSQITENTPLSLAKAAEIAFPDGRMKASSLRYEAAKGRLVVERIAGKDYTTLAYVARMRELCRQQPKARGSGSGQKAEPENRSGSSETEASSSALDAALMNAKRLAKGLPIERKHSLRRVREG